MVNGSRFSNGQYGHRIEDMIEIRKARPILRKKEYIEEEWQGRETLALLIDEKHVPALTGFIKQIVMEALYDNIIVLRFAESAEQILSSIKDSLQNYSELKMYPKSRRGIFFIPGTLVSKINTSSELERILEHWGRVDLLDLIVSREDMLGSVLELLEKDVYESSAKNLLSILNVSTFIIRDSGDGNEAEIIYKVENSDYVKSLLAKASTASGIRLSQTAND